MHGSMLASFLLNFLTQNQESYHRIADVYSLNICIQTQKLYVLLAFHHVVTGVLIGH